jgi:hypothetical protein
LNTRSVRVPFIQFLYCTSGPLTTRVLFYELDYIEARKNIYLPEYIKCIKNLVKFRELEKRIEKGENLLIIEVDGPHQESLDYYKEKYGVSDDFIEESTILATKENLDIMLNDEKRPFGHGYCLAWESTVDSQTRKNRNDFKNKFINNII